MTKGLSNDTGRLQHGHGGQRSTYKENGDERKKHDQVCLSRCRLSLATGKVRPHQVRLCQFELD